MLRVAAGYWISIMQSCPDSVVPLLKIDHVDVG